MKKRLLPINSLLKADIDLNMLVSPFFVTNRFINILVPFEVRVAKLKLYMARNW